MPSKQRGQRNNPASRISEIVDKMYYQGDWDKRTFKEVWRVVLNGNSKDELELLVRLKEVNAEIDFITTFAEKSEAENSRWLKFLPLVKDEFSWVRADEFFKNRPMSDAVPLVLEYFSGEMSDEPLDPDAQLGELLKEVNGLFNEVGNMNIQRSLKTWIMELLHMMSMGIQRYFIYGARGLRAELFKIYGSFHEHYHDLQEAEPATALKLKEAITHYANVTTLLIGAGTIGCTALKALGFGG